MKVSKNRNRNNSGFTLIELVVVVMGLSVLASFAIPNVLNRVKINRVEEAKALMNGYAANCIGKFRTSLDYDDDFLDKAVPDDLSNEKLSTLQYKIDKDKCSELAISPLKEDEKDLFAFSFEIGRDGRVFKKGTPPTPTSTNEPFLQSCKNWAGKNCGMSAEDKAEYERLKALEKAKSECISEYSKWLNGGNSGESVTWDNINESCTRPVFAFEGIPVNSLEAIEQALKNKYGRACSDWRESKKGGNSISPNGNPETKEPECGGVNYWFHSGNEFTTQAAWTAFDNQLKAQACTKDRSNALSSNRTGKYTYGPSPGPDPCGKVVWLCKGEEYGTPDAYATTSCGAPPQTPPGPYIPPHCRNFKPHPYCKGRPQVRNHPLCKCR